MQKPVYLDYHATTPVDPRVLDQMLPFFGPKFGNSASRSHSFGWDAEKAVDLARKRVANLAGCTPREIVFTSGATESNNLAIKGVIETARSAGLTGSIVTVATEHRAVLDPVKRLQRMGFRAIILPVRSDGILELDRLGDAIQPDTLLVSVMYANNEIGAIQPIARIGALCHERRVLFHCDAAQAFGKIPIHVERDHIDLMSISAHKIYGPKGAGALYVRRRNPRVQVAAEMDGGGHEFGMRSGTLNVPGIVGLGAASELCASQMDYDAESQRTLRDRLLSLLEAQLPGLRVNGSMEHRLPNNLNLSFAGVSASALLTSMPDVALSSGSACSSATPEPSHVLRALGLSEEVSHSSLRFGLGRFTDIEEIDYVARRVAESVRQLRSLTPA
ncbi:MAG TPA: aminotransferase class V-fold PLP-dependent enzyme [Bryobacteraceae bacterium]|nr:aminotransferase class V-fold PLP-dependent enzyme [Bryobacteraceae bacterium]